MEIENFDCTYAEDPTEPCIRNEGCKQCEEYKGITYNIINLTPHEVTIVLDEKHKLYEKFPSEGIARCTQETTPVKNIAYIPITSTSFGKVEGLPETKENTYYIVSRLIREALPDRKDLLVPNEIVRDDDGKIIGCKSLAMN